MISYFDAGVRIVQVAEARGNKNVHTWKKLDKTEKNIVLISDGQPSETSNPRLVVES